MAQFLRRAYRPFQAGLHKELVRNGENACSMQMHSYASVAMTEPLQKTIQSSPGQCRHMDRRHFSSSSEPPLEHEDLPDPLNPHEHPLATVGQGELSIDKQYWRKRQAEAPRPVYLREVDKNGVSYATGKRKTSVARVWLREGDGTVSVNGKDWVDYFPRADHRDQIMRPLFLLGRAGEMSVECAIAGGGQSGQAEALRHGVARAMLKYNPEWRAKLKGDGLLTRDSRIVEPKKYGRKKARKSPTWVKR